MAMATIEIAGIALLSLLLVILILFIRSKVTHLITHPLTNWPIIGHLGPFMCSRLGINDYATYLLAHSSRDTAHLKGPWFAKEALVVTSDPENIHYILSSKASNFNKGPKLKAICKTWGDGILMAEGDSWRLQRRLIHSLFRHESFNRLVEKAARDKLENGMFSILDNAANFGTEVELQGLFLRYAMDLSCKFLFGTDLNSLSLGLPKIPFSSALDECKKVMFIRHLKLEAWWRLQKWMGVGVEGRATKAELVVDEFIYQQILLKREKRFPMGAQEDENFDMISRFIAVEEEASHDNDDHTATMPITDRFLRDSTLNILSAGKDTTSMALAWFFWLVSTHPSVERNLKNELREAFGLKEGKNDWPFPTYQEINKLVYLQATINESLRLYPPIPFNPKASVKADTLPSGQQVGKDASIILAIYPLGRMEKIWGADCLEFKPERWISEKGEIIHVATSKFNVFSSGPRACVGKDLALMEMKMAITALIWNYHFQVVQGHMIVPANSTLLYMKHGLKVHVTKNNRPVKCV